MARARQVLRAALGVGLGLGLLGPALAQPMLAPSPAVACLTQAPGTLPLEYPPEMLARKDGGTVNAEYTFKAPDQPPEVKVLRAVGSTFDALIVAVETHAKSLRLPCLVAGGPPVVLTRSYLFEPNDGRKVVGTVPRDQADVQRAKQLACLRHVVGEDRPTYPASALRRQQQGNVLVRLSFAGADQPPTVSLLADGPLRVFWAAVQDHAAGFRVPCLGSEPFTMTRLFAFRMDGGKRLVLKDITVEQWLGATKDLPQGVYFDLNTMQCPFDLRLTYRRPHQNNFVQQLETANPARQPFLDWLALATLKVDENRNTDLLGDAFVLHVPCLKIDL